MQMRINEGVNFHSATIRIEFGVRAPIWKCSGHLPGVEERAESWRFMTQGRLWKRLGLVPHTLHETTGCFTLGVQHEQSTETKSKFSFLLQYKAQVYWNFLKFSNFPNYFKISSYKNKICLLSKFRSQSPHKFTLVFYWKVMALRENQKCGRKSEFNPHEVVTFHRKQSCVTAEKGSSCLALEIM